MENIKCAYCGIKIVPTELDFKVDEGWPYVPGNQTMRVEREGSGELFPRWSATVDADWVELRPSHSDKEETVIVSVQSVGKPAGDYEAKVTSSSAEANNTPVFAAIKLTITPKPVPPKPLKIITASLPDGELNKLYACQVEAEGGVEPYHWSWLGLPEGLFFNNQAKIYGVPTVSGTFPVTISIQDSSQNSYEMEYTLTITKPPVKVAIMSPKGGEVFHDGDTEDITWVAENAGDETLDIHLILDGVIWIIATDIPVKSLGYLWTISGIPASENAVIMLLTNYQTVQCPPFAIRERSGCVPWPLAKALSKLRKLAKAYWEM